VTQDRIDINFKKYKLLAITLITLFIIFLSYVDYFDISNNTIVFDKFQGDNLVTNNIVVLKIDDESINRLGRWPWDRSVYSSIEQLDSASVIAIDVSLLESSDTDYIFEQTLKNMNADVILVNEIQDRQYLPVFDTKTGYANIIGDDDAIVRRAYFDLDNNESLEQTIYSSYMNINFKESNYGETLDNRPIINYANPNSFEQLPFYEFYYNQTNMSFDNKIVYIGATASDLHDMYLAPIAKRSLIPGVFIHANILNNMLRKDFITNIPVAYVIILMIVIAVLFYFMRTLKSTFITSVVLFALNIIVSLLLFSNNIMFEFVDIALLIIFLTLINVAIITTKAKKKKNFISNVFNKYISKDLLNDIMKDPSKLKLGGQKKDIGIMFSDVRNFTSISEKLTPEEVLDFLNTYFVAATKSISKNKGFVDKFIGDAIMALWNAPVDDKDYALNMTLTAIELKDIVKQLVDDYRNTLGVEFGTGIGINIGDAVVGNLGGEEKINYSAIGDSVNLASRLEGLTKKYGVIVLASQSVIDKLSRKKILFRKLDYVKVKGKNKPIYIYEIVERAKNKTLKIMDMIESYEDALELYFKKDFDNAYLEFNRLYDEYNDYPSRLLAERITELKAQKLENWDGSYKWESK